MLFAGPPRFFTLEAGSLLRSYVDAGGRVAWAGTGGLTQPVELQDGTLTAAPGRKRRNLFGEAVQRGPGGPLTVLGDRIGFFAGSGAPSAPSRRSSAVDRLPAGARVAGFGRQRVRAAGRGRVPARQGSRCARGRRRLQPRGAQLPDPRADNAQAMDPALALGGGGREARRRGGGRSPPPERSSDRNPRARALSVACALIAATVVLVGHICEHGPVPLHQRQRSALRRARARGGGRGRGPGGRFHAAAGRCSLCSPSPRFPSASRSRPAGTTANLLVPLYFVIAGACGGVRLAPAAAQARSRRPPATGPLSSWRSRPFLVAVCAAVALLA